jgi:hypothetical protein
MQVKVALEGTTPLICHNIALVDPDNPIVQQIATYTSKRKKTVDDRKAIERLEWFGGLYLDQGVPSLPTGNVRKSLIQSGKISKQGTQVARALQFADLYIPIIHEGPSELEAMYAKPEYSNRSAVGVSGKRVMRVRPTFYPWSLTATAHLLEDVMDLDDLIRVADRAGLAEGIGDNRTNGYGRYTVRVTS